jgi:hypothetical protein
VRSEHLVLELDELPALVAVRRRLKDNRPGFLATPVLGSGAHVRDRVGDAVRASTSWKELWVNEETNV